MSIISLKEIGLHHIQFEMHCFRGLCLALFCLVPPHGVESVDQGDTSIQILLDDAANACDCREFCSNAQEEKQVSESGSSLAQKQDYFFTLAYLSSPCFPLSSLHI